MVFSISSPLGKVGIAVSGIWNKWYWKNENVKDSKSGQESINTLHIQYAIGV